MAFYPDTSFDNGELEHSPYTPGLLEKITTFKKIKIALWTSENCVDWAVSICKKRSLQPEGARAFRQVSGQDLLQYNVEDFCLLTNSIEGPVFHREFCKLRQKRSSRSAQPQNSCPTLDQLQPSLTSAGIYSNMDEYLQESTLDKRELFFPEPSLQARQFDDDLYSLHGGGSSPDDLYSSPLPGPSGAYPEVDVAGPSYCGPGWNSGPQGALPGPSASTEAFARIKNPKRKTRERNPTIVEVLMRLLEHPATNPKVIKWQDQERGIFRIVDKEFIVKLWVTRGGKVASKEDEDQDKLKESFERTLRHHYGKELEKEKMGIYVFTPDFLLKYRTMQNRTERT
ncbi:uncharacterized protein LOC143036293 [Oratosquilla oratoria]|uniref:uncharacterized protein LOC143036293 n=1 Tax=Oratosquilla oratoria TaxID=337810 RepID=UPI003F76B43E